MTVQPGPGLLVVPDVRLGRGLGHLHRCLALAAAWTDDGGEASVLVPASSETAVDRVAQAGLTPQLTARGSRPSPTEIAEAAADVKWCVLDGYDFGDEDRHAAAAAGFAAVIDDHGRSGASDVDLIIDQNPGAVAKPYQAAAAEGAWVLAGGRYTLLGRDFQSVPEQTRDRLVVIMGGDPEPESEAFAAAVLDAVALPTIAVDVVGLPDVAARAGAHTIGSGDALAPVFARARLVFSGAGSTTWELARMGTPALLVALADNQVAVGRTAEAVGAAEFLGTRDELEPTDVARTLESLWADDRALEEMARTGESLVDGHGAARVSAALRGRALRLREVTSDDACLLWRWANEPEVRAMAFDPDPIPWEDHQAWLTERLQRSETAFYVALNEAGEPWAQVRFDRHDDRPGRMEVSVSIDRAHRGRGVGGPLLVAASRRLVADHPDVHAIDARIKAENQASMKAFDRAGFVRVGLERGVHDLIWRTR